MKQPDFLNELLTPVKRQARNICISSLFAAGVISQSAFGQQTFTFTNASATGSLGPTQAMINTAYASTNLNGSVTIGAQQGIQQFTVPATGAYRIEARGGQGYGNGFGGRGAVMAGDFTLTAGSVLKILVGQAGILTSVSSSNFQFGGAGGSFVTDMSNVPYVVAGGGGASWASAFPSAADAPTVTTGNTGFNGPTNGAGGTTGAGGSAGSSADAGGGITGNGGGTAGGKSFINGGNGGTYLSYGIGAFGGGGGTSSSNNARSGGGGGYSGGGGAGSSASGAPVGGGGGSYNAGANQTNVAANNLGNGLVIISKLCNLNITSTSSLICTGSTVTLTTNSTGTYTWNNGTTNTANIVVSPTVTTTYTLSGYGTTPANCAATAAFIVTVNRTPTVSISSSTTSACLGQTVSLTASGANTYSWNNGVSNGVAFTPTSGTTPYTVSGTNACGTTTAGITLTVSALPVTATSSSTLLCSGSAATLTAGGATTYTWLPGTITLSTFIASPTVSTVYTVTGQTGNCMGTALLSVTTKTLPVLGIAAVNGTTMCHGNSNTLTATGDATTFSWNTNQVTANVVITPTLSTLYVLTGTNVVNCSRSVSQLIHVDHNPVLSVTASNPEICANGTSTLSASGADTYSWGAGNASYSLVVNPASATAYNVTGTNMLTGCYTSTVITVNVFEPEISVSSNTTICNGGHAIISAQGATTYTWANTTSVGNIPGILVSPNISTTYSVSGNVTHLQTGVSCIAYNTIDVTVLALPGITATSNHTAICRGQSATLTADGAGATGTYTWGASLGNNAVVSITPVLDHAYNVTATDANGCKNTATVQVTVSSCTGIDAVAATMINVMAYPNPSHGMFTVSSEEAITLSITNQLGQQVKVIELTAGTSSVNVSDLSTGVYYLTGKNENGSVKQKIVVAD